MTIFVSMLRGVNVGGTSRIKMATLQELYESLGLRDVRTLLQSGNVVFRSNLTDRVRLSKRLMQEIERQLDLKVDVIIRTLAEIQSIVERSPVLSPHADLSKLLVMFLADVPDAQAQASLLKAHSGPEMLEIRGPEVYLDYPNGVGRSKLSGALIENKLHRSGTARTWHTITKLLEAGRQLDTA
jgi:uncharacterized protein (DUF1697 family)